MPLTDVGLWVNMFNVMSSAWLLKKVFQVQILKGSGQRTWVLTVTDELEVTPTMLTQLGSTFAPWAIPLMYDDCTDRQTHASATWQSFSFA